MSDALTTISVSAGGSGGAQISLLGTASWGSYYAYEGGGWNAYAWTGSGQLFAIVRMTAGAYDGNYMLPAATGLCVGDSIPAPGNAYYYNATVCYRDPICTIELNTTGFRSTSHMINTRTNCSGVVAVFG